jgi:flagellar biosynthesis/type III secretory pathway M-ring protein FliF/YscJ
MNTSVNILIITGLLLIVIGFVAADIADNLRAKRDKEDRTAEYKRRSDEEYYLSCIRRLKAERDAARAEQRGLLRQLRKHGIGRL